MGGLSVTRAMGDLDSRWVEARCQNRHSPMPGRRPACAERGNGLGKLLCRYTTECLVPGAQIELKCEYCGQVTVVKSS